MDKHDKHDRKNQKLGYMLGSGSGRAQKAEAFASEK
jgi:hypothetical protein